jgi:hypothetical protein
MAKQEMERKMKEEEDSGMEEDVWLEKVVWRHRLDEGMNFKVQLESQFGAGF